MTLVGYVVIQTHKEAEENGMSCMEHVKTSHKTAKFSLENGEKCNYGKFKLGETVYGYTVKCKSFGRSKVA